ncbi:S-locus-specific glycoprotein BS29-2-like [Hevea brasiliensis]|uniref:S-locus-specific glycoprotein BS29-2-like n=1 Tax=Hevea brasiliensis TaxID=3981 RepID=UPI0025D6F1BA|nr:S-locus-specific glycoprotein BS29-2-like [Hevea brasiliensis]
MVNCLFSGCATIDTIRSSLLLKYPEVIVSPSLIFKMGFLAQLTLPIAMLEYGTIEVLWSTHISNLAVNSSRAYLTDTGNFILQGDAAGSMWESFWQPSDTMVQAMGLDVNGKRGKGPQLTSSENPSDPSIGSSSVDCDANRIPEFFIWNDSKPLEKYSMESNTGLRGTVCQAKEMGFEAGNDETARLSYLPHNNNVNKIVGI